MKTTATEAATITAIAATRGPATNVRAGGPMEDRRTRRNRSRADQRRNAIEAAS